MFENHSLRLILAHAGPMRKWRRRLPSQMRCGKVLGMGIVEEARERLPPGAAQYLLHLVSARKKSFSDPSIFRPQKGLTRLCAHAIPNTVMARIRGQQTFAPCPPLPPRIRGHLPYNSRNFCAAVSRDNGLSCATMKGFQRTEDSHGLAVEPYFRCPTHNTARPRNDPYSYRWRIFEKPLPLA